MEWQDDAIVLSSRKHGETSIIAELLTRDHGRHLGIVRGGTSRRLRAALQPGSSLRVNWRARLSEHLGSFSIEPTKVRAAGFLDDVLALEAVQAASALCSICLPERERHVALYEVYELFLEALDDESVWPAIYVRWELGLLRELGFGLDLEKCVSTGAVEELTHVSPRSGCAVSAEAAAPYLDRLLPLPSFLRENSLTAVSVADIRDGLALSGYFLDRRVLRVHEASMPDIRLRLEERIRTMAESD